MDYRRGGCWHFLSPRIIYGVVFYAVIMTMIMLQKPRLFYDDNGNVRHFGFGGNKTLFSLTVINASVAIVIFFFFSIMDVIQKH